MAKAKLSKELRGVLNAASKYLGGYYFSNLNKVQTAQDVAAVLICAVREKEFTLRDLQGRAWSNSEAKGFHKVPALDPERLNVVLKLMLIVTEVSEVMEELRNGRKLNETYYREDGKPEGVPAELADIAVRLGDLCGIVKIDLEAAVKEKMAYNIGRPFLHGRSC